MTFISLRPQSLGQQVALELILDRSSEQEARSWIEGIAAQINSYEKITVSWKEGALGGEKLDLFRGSTSFAFPSQHKVEARPPVLLKAMASGCAIITSTVEEIPSTVSPNCSSIWKIVRLRRWQRKCFR